MAEMEHLMSEEEKNVFVSRYEDLEFLDDVEGLKCGRCQRVAIKHYYANCQHVFCKNCQNMLREAGRYANKCPVCKKDIINIDLQDINFERKIIGVKVFCLNRKYGCKFSGALKDTATHLRTCKDTWEAALPVELVLPRDTSEVWSILRDLSEHVRNLKTQIVELTPFRDRVQVLEMKIDELCETNPIPKSEDGYNVQKLGQQSVLEKMNGKKEVEKQLGDIKQRLDEKLMKNDDLLKYKNEIDEKLIKIVNDNETKLTESKLQITSLEKVKDEMQVRTKIMENSLKAQTTKLMKNDDVLQTVKKYINELDQRLKMAVNELSGSKLQITSLEKVKDEMQMKINTLENSLKTQTATMDALELNRFHSLAYQWTVTGIMKKMERKVYQEESPVFPLCGYQFGAKAKIQVREDGIVNVSLCFVDTKKTGKSMAFKVIPEVTYILRDRNGNEDDRTRTHNYLFHATFSFNSYYYEIQMIHKSKIVTSPYALGDSFVIDILVEPPSIALRSQSHDGVMACKINDYRRKKSMEEEFLVRYQPSPYFYTSLEGYRMQGGVWLHGFGDFRGKGLTVMVDFMPGEFDSVLGQSFKHRTTIVIFNQKDWTKRLVKSVENDIKDLRTDSIDIPQSDLESGGYLDSDTLVYRACIEALSDD